MLVSIIFVVLLVLAEHSSGSLLNGKWSGGSGKGTRSEACPRQEGCRSRSVSEVYRWRVLRYDAPAVPLLYNPLAAFVSGVDTTPTAMLIMTSREGTITPATVSYVPLPSKGSDPSPVLKPYPDLEWNTIKGKRTDCNKTLVSVQRTIKDGCNRVWMIDAGVVLNFIKPQVICPPKIAIFNLDNNQLVRIITIPQSVLTPVSVLSNIRLDNVFTSPGSNSSSGSCDDTYVYISDPPSSALIVHKSPGDTFYSISHPTMHPDPRHYNLTVQGEVLHYFQGVLGIAVGGSDTSRRLYYQSPSSDKVYSMPTASLQAGPVQDITTLPVEVAITKPSESSDLLVDQADGCLLYNPITQGSILAWSPTTQTSKLVATDTDLITVMENYNQAGPTTVYGTSSRVQKYLNMDVKPYEINLRILKIDVNC